MIWLDFLIALSCGGAGLACGWVMHAMVGISGHPKGSVATKPKPTPEVSQADMKASMKDTEAQRERVSDAAERLKSYAFSMAADVDAHQSKVQAVNNSLNENGESSPEAVSEAIHQLVEANEAMQSQLQRAQDQIHEQALQIESAEKRAETDALTRVPNRGAFDRHLAQRHELGSKVASTLAMLDVDHFKKFNDVYGHRAGDEVLRVVAGMLHSRLNERGIVARFGGEEFAVILDGYDVHRAAQFVEEARRAVSEREIQFEGKRLRVTASVGLAQLSSGVAENADGEASDSSSCESVEQWLQRSDDGLYFSKEAGRDCGHWMNGDNAVKIELEKASNVESKSTPAADAATADTEEPSAVTPLETLETTATPSSVEETDVKGDSVKGDSMDKTGGKADQTKEEATRNPADEDPAAEKSASEKSASEKSAVEPAEPTSGPFASLPNRKAMAKEFSEMQERAGASVTTFFTAIRCHSDASPSTMRSLLQVVRATLRNVDRLGYQDQSTLLVCMPSVDQETAKSRGEQICRSAASIGLSNDYGEQRAISIGVAEIASDEEFDQVVERSILMADQGRNPDHDVVNLDAEPAAAV